MVGNEKGYVVAIPPCSFPEGYTINQGDRISLYSNYSVPPLPLIPAYRTFRFTWSYHLTSPQVALTDPRTFDRGAHGGVMSLWYMAISPK